MRISVTSLLELLMTTIKYIAYSIKENNEKINWDEMTNKEKRFLEYFYILNKTEKEVSSIIGISQQGVNKRKRKILEKYKIKQK